MLNLNETLIRSLIKELISEYYQSKLPSKWEIDLKFNNRIKQKKDSAPASSIAPPSSKPPPSSKSEIEQNFENWWVNTKQDFKKFKNWYEIYKEYLKSNQPPKDNKDVEKLKRMMIFKLSHESRVNQNKVST